MSFRLKEKLHFQLAVALVCLASAHALAQEIRVMVSGGFSAPYQVLIARFQQATGAHVETVWGPSMGTTPVAIPMRLSRGESADVVIMARSQLDALAQKGIVVEGSQVDLARSRIGMAVRSGATIPDISSVAAFRRALLKARSVAYSDSASGTYIATKLFKRMGIARQMLTKSRQIAAEPVGLSVARGEVEIGFQQMSELLPVGGITVIGPIPAELQEVTVFSAGVVARSDAQEPAHSLIRYLASPSACATIKQAALEPVACLSGRK
jgi:molybdate transport system substrate-binding protein